MPPRKRRRRGLIAATAKKRLIRDLKVAAIMAVVFGVFLKMSVHTFDKDEWVELAVGVASALGAIRAIIREA